MIEFTAGTSPNIIEISVLLNKVINNRSIPSLPVAPTPIFVKPQHQYKNCYKSKDDGMVGIMTHNSSIKLYLSALMSRVMESEECMKKVVENVSHSLGLTSLEILSIVRD